MVSRIILAAQNQQNLESLRKSKAELARCTYQVSTGKKGETYADLKEQAASFLRDEETKKKIQSYIDNNTFVDTRLEALEMSIRALTNITKKFQEFLVTCRASIVPPGASYIASNFLSQVVTQLNSQDMEGRYIFAGTRTNISPVHVESMTSLADSNIIDTSYYQGDKTILKTSLDANQPMNYGILADNPAFESLIRSLRMAQSLNYSDIDASKYAISLNTLQSAMGSINTLFAQIGENRLKITQSLKVRQDNLQLLETLMEEKIGIDHAEVLTRTSRLNNQINSSYYAINQLNSLSFLKNR